MKISKILAVGVVAVTVAGLSVTQVDALTIRQSQEMSNTTSVKVEGAGTAEAKVEQWGKQSQKVETPDWQNRRGDAHDRRGYGWKKYSENRDGEVPLSWDHRGGTCHVRYTEAGNRHFNYHTSTNCDDGEITIGGLVTGRNYKFQVRKDDGSWSHPTNVKAW